MVFDFKNFFQINFKHYTKLCIFEDISRICNLRRIFELMKILHIRLWSMLRNWRIFVFVFGPFSIFVATLPCTMVGKFVNNLKLFCIILPNLVILIKTGLKKSSYIGIYWQFRIMLFSLIAEQVNMYLWDSSSFYQKYLAWS